MIIKVIHNERLNFMNKSVNRTSVNFEYILSTIFKL